MNAEVENKKIRKQLLLCCFLLSTVRLDAGKIPLSHHYQLTISFSISVDFCQVSCLFIKFLSSAPPELLGTQNEDTSAFDIGILDVREWTDKDC